MEAKSKRSSSWLKPAEPELSKSSSFSLAPKKVTEVFSSILPGQKSKDSESEDEQEYSMMEKSESGDHAENEVDHKFHKVFALDEKEVLLDRESYV